jgi:peptidoglycan hydrolase-like protein with peptidoglycan-binding domain
MTKDEVKSLQTKLNKLGYELDVDGDFGPCTENAVINFQANNSLTATGEVDEATINSIDAMVAKLENPQKTFEEIVREISTDADEWIEKVDVMQNAAEADGDIGAFEFCKYFKILVVKAYYHK